MNLRINTKKRLYRQYIRTRDIEKYPSKLFNFKRTKWRSFKKLLGTTAKYKFRKFEQHKDRYFIKTKFNFIKRLVLPKITDPFLYTPKAARWNKRRKTFLMRWLRDKAIKYDYGNLIPRHKPLKSDEHEEILTTRFFSMYYRLGYLLIHNKYFFTFPEVKKNLQNKLVHVKNGSLDSIAEMPKGAIVNVQNKNFLMDFSNRPFLYNFKYRYLYNPKYNEKFTTNYISTTISKKLFRLLKFFSPILKKKSKIKKLPLKKKKKKKHFLKLFKKAAKKHKISLYQLFRKKKFQSKLTKLKKKWKNLYKATTLTNYIIHKFNSKKRKIKLKTKKSLKLKKRHLRRYRKNKLQIPYSLKRSSIINGINQIKLKNRKKKIISNKEINLKKRRKPSKLNELEILLKEVKTKVAIRKLFSNRTFKYMFFQSKRKNRSKESNMKKVIKRRIFLPFMEKDRYAQAFAIIKHQRNLSRNDCILINPRKKRITKPSFLRNRQ